MVRIISFIESNKKVYSKVDNLKEKNWNENYLKICCHSQHVERLVSVTSEAALNVVGQKKRHAYIINKTQYCEDVKTNFKKADYSGLVTPMK